MKYTEFRDPIEQELQRTPEGLTWKELRDRLNLPYQRACPAWTKELESEIGLMREKGDGRELVWRVPA